MIHDKKRRTKTILLYTGCTKLSPSSVGIDCVAAKETVRDGESERGRDRERREIWVDFVFVYLRHTQVSRTAARENICFCFVSIFAVFIGMCVSICVWCFRVPSS